MIDREEGCDAGNGLDSEHGVGNGLDRRRVYIVVDMPAYDVLAF